MWNDLAAWIHWVYSLNGTLIMGTIGALVGLFIAFRFPAATQRFREHLHFAIRLNPLLCLYYLFGVVPGCWFDDVSARWLNRLESKHPVWRWVAHWPMAIISPGTADDTRHLIASLQRRTHHTVPVAPDYAAQMRRDGYRVRLKDKKPREVRG